MAVYRNIQTTFWTDARIADDFTPEDRYFYLYLFTNPHTNLCGCYEISKKQVALETGYSIESIDSLLKRFENVHKVIRFSPDTKEVLIVNWYKYNWTLSKDFRKALFKEITAIKCVRFKDYLTAIYEGAETVLPPSYDGGGITVTDTVSVTDTVTDSEKNTPAWNLRFAKFWEIYPKKQGKGAAEKSWDKIRPSAELFEKIMYSVKANIDGNPQWHKDGGQYIPNPATWLNQKRWEDATDWVICGNHGYEERTLTKSSIDALERKKLGIGG